MSHQEIASSLSNRRGVRRMLTAALVSAVLAMSTTPLHAADPLTSYAAISTAADQLSKVADEALANGDNVLHERIQQAVNGLRLILKELDPMLNRVQETANEAVNTATRNAMEILANLHIDGRVAGSYGSAKLNQTLATTSELLSALPLIEVPPSLHALTPSRIDLDQRKRLFRVFGYLPGTINDDVEVFVGEQKVRARRGGASSISFSLPAQLRLTPEQRVAVRVDAKEHYGPFDLLWKTHTFDETILIGKPKPFACQIDSFGENENYRQRVRATRQAIVDASTQGGAGRATVDKTFNADDLLIATIGAEAAHAYDLKTVTILDLGLQFQRWGQCRSQGPSVHHEILSGGAQARVRVRAPRVEQTLRCSAGGTHGQAVLLPTFLVARKDAQPTKLAGTAVHSFGSEGLHLNYPVPAGDQWSAHLKCAYSEAGEKWNARTMVLNSRNRQETARGLLAQLRDGRLSIEPLDPLKFDDELR